jgi:small subunit ribosomal protein S6
MTSTYFKFKTEIIYNDEMIVNTAQAKDKLITPLIDALTIVGIGAHDEDYQPGVIFRPEVNRIDIIYYQEKALIPETNQIFHNYQHSNLISSYNTKLIEPEETIDLRMTKTICFSKCETIMILRPDLEPEDIESIINEYKDFIKLPQVYHETLVHSLDEDEEDTDIKINNMGKKKLAYDAKGFEHGHYVQFNYWQENSYISDIEMKLRHDDRVLKFVTVRSDDGISKFATDVQVKSQFLYGNYSTPDVSITEQESDSTPSLENILAEFDVQ